MKNLFLSFYFYILYIIGDSVVVDSDNFSLEALSNDVINVLSTLFPEEQPPITLVGHR